MKKISYDFENPHDDRNVKRCRKCREVKSVSHFPWRKDENQYAARCYACINEWQRSWHSKRAKGGPPLWTDEQKAKLRECIIAGMGPSETAVAVGRSLQAVSAQRQRESLPRFTPGRRGPAGHRPKWPAERVEQLRQLRDGNVPYRQCAAVLGITKGAVAGAIDRYLREDA
jgi:transposase-like protein